MAAGPAEAVPASALQRRSCRNLRRRECPPSRAWAAARRRVFPASAAQRRRLVFRRRELGFARRRSVVGCRRLGLVVGDDAPDRRQNLLHRGFLDLCRLRHLRLQIINALACVVLHQARRNLPVPVARARDFRRKPDLSPDQARRESSRKLRPARGIEASWPRRAACARESLGCLGKGMSWQLTIASNGLWSELVSTAQLQPHVLAAAPSSALADEKQTASSRDDARATTSGISARRACERRTSCRAPAGNARSDRRSWSPG